MVLLIVTIIKFLELVQLLLIVRILLSWFPNINWYNQPFKTLDALVEPILAPFRRIIPPIGGMLDISPIVPIILINIIIQIIAGFGNSMIQM